MIEFFNAISKFLLNVPPFAVVFPDEGGIFLRGGKYRRTVYAGFYWKLPFYDNVIKIPIKEQIINLPNQSVTTKDKKILALSGAVRFEVADPRHAILYVQDYDTSIQNLAMGVMASYVSRVNLDDCTYDKLTEEVLSELQIECSNWGLSVLNVWLTDIAEHKVYRIMSQDTPVLIGE